MLRNFSCSIDRKCLNNSCRSSRLNRRSVPECWIFIYFTEGSEHDASHIPAQTVHSWKPPTSTPTKYEPKRSNISNTREATPPKPWTFTIPLTRVQTPVCAAFHYHKMTSKIGLRCLLGTADSALSMPNHPMKTKAPC